MSDSVVIKEVESETILLDDTTTSVFTGKSWLKLCFIFIILFGISWGMLTDAVSRPNSTPIPAMPIAAVLSIGASLMLGVLGMYHSDIPAYTVSLQGRYQCRRDIIKTTPGNDQVAICRVAKEMEVEALSFIKKERELKQIAQKCK